MGAWFSKNWWVVLILGLILVGIWYYLTNQEKPIVVTKKYPCQGHEDKIKTQIEEIENNTDWKAIVKKQLDQNDHVCHKEGLTYEECLRVNAVHYLVNAGKIPASCKTW
ncbi:hypothetical protein [Aureispira anguillae]|uniref:Uncharacterized protein n=1 Tax=Aureispira anguillae TaxID=2864201 RepID=A0A916DQI1_9BACT|nr:hypothetical protein [Aureispira anguillae]BDS10105.1 hypothetical protein AsAng_0008120 [Aureispira anguillae]